MDLNTKKISSYAFSKRMTIDFVLPSETALAHSGVMLLHTDLGS